MQIPSALVALTTVLGLAPSSSAFLITPDIADAATHAEDSFKSLLFGRTHAVDIACHECPFFVDEERDNEKHALLTVALNDVANSIHLEITANEVGLQINNATIYPFEAIGPPVYAHQNRLDDNAQGIEVSLDFAAAVKPAVHDDPKTSAHAPQEDMYELIPIDFAVVAISSIPVSAQSIHVDLMHNLVDNTYEIVRVIDGDYEPKLRLGPCTGRPAYSACRLRHSIEQQLKEALSATKGRAHGIKDWLKTDPLRSIGRPCHGKHGAFKGASDMPGQHTKGGPKHTGQHHGHHGVHAMHVLRAIHTAIHFVVIPALLGVAGGLAASAVGMLVGQTIAYCWARFGRGSRRNPVPNARTSEVENIADEKAGLLIHDEEPPQYRDVDVEAEMNA